jgi:hypothetical protein
MVSLQPGISKPLNLKSRPSSAACTNVVPRPTISFIPRLELGVGLPPNPWYELQNRPQAWPLPFRRFAKVH